MNRAGRRVANCPNCGASPFEDARFCTRCGAGLPLRRPGWARGAARRGPAAPKIALSCPECGEPMRWGFRKICRRCGAELVMVPRLLHPYHVRVYVRGPSAALARLGVTLFWMAVAAGILGLASMAAK